VVAVKAIACELPALARGCPCNGCTCPPDIRSDWIFARYPVFGRRCEPTTGIQPFGRLVDQVMRDEPYRSARRLFWVLDNGRHITVPWH
jgi:hypothetical protein